MSKEKKLINIPPVLEPLFQIETATEVIREAAHLLRESNEIEQQVIIKYPVFSNLIGNALVGLDQRRKQGINRLLNSVAPSNVQALKESLGLEENR